MGSACSSSQGVATEKSELSHGGKNSIVISEVSHGGGRTIGGLSEPKASPAMVQKARSPPRASATLPKLNQYSQHAKDLILGNVQGIIPNRLNVISMFTITTESGSTTSARDAAYKELYPGIQQYTESLGYQLDYLDTYEIPNHLQMGGVRRQYLRLITQHSAHVVLLVYLSETKPGLDVLPGEVSATEFDGKLMDGADESTRALLHKYYKRDNNNVPPSYKMFVESGTDYHESELAELLLWLIEKKGIHSEIATLINIVPADRRSLVVICPENVDPISDRIMSGFTSETIKLLDVDKIPGIVRKQIDDVTEKGHHMFVRGFTPIMQRRMYSHLIKCQRITRMFQGLYGSFLDEIYPKCLDIRHPIVLHGSNGGLTVTAASFVDTVTKDSYNLPGCACVVRFLANGASIRDLLQNICEQICVLYGVQQAVAYQTVEGYNAILLKLLNKAEPARPLVVVIDGLHHLTTNNYDWLPSELPEHVTFVVTIDSQNVELLQSVLTAMDCYYEVPPLSLKDIVTVSDVMFNAASHTLASNQRQVFLDGCSQTPSPEYVHLISHWLTSVGSEIEASDLVFKPKISEQLEYGLEQLEAKYGQSNIAKCMCCLVCAKDGLTFNKICDILHRSLNFTFHRSCQMLCEIIVNLSPVMCTNTGSAHSQFTIHSDDALTKTISHRYSSNMSAMEVAISKYFNEKSHTTLMQLILSTNDLGTNLLNFETLQKFITTYGIVEVLKLLDDHSEAGLTSLRDFLEFSVCPLSLDPSQLSLQLVMYCSLNGSSPGLKNLEEAAQKRSLLLPVPGQIKSIHAKAEGQDAVLTGIFRLPTNKRHVVAISKSKGEIYVLDPYTHEVVRSIEGVNEPKDVRLVNDHKAVVLCTRELKVYNLDTGVLESTLKGVLNLQHPYFGLHDSDHVVALSRNRMYVNIMKIDSGDMAATFKAGEDRFLDSLLVSANGKVCICGDEVQKPFPLLVWDLVNRKLIFDLRIPQHEFITSMSAISNDGHFVVCVCKELDDPSPNFIIVYDLDTGQLYKKWQPHLDTSAVAISSEGHCVIQALIDGSIIVWDLVGGAVRHKLTGHKLAVDCITFDEDGKRCVTWDSTGNDVTIKLWDLEKGSLLGGFGCCQPLACCELSSDGTSIFIGLSNTDDVVTLRLSTNGNMVPEPTSSSY